MSNIIKVQIFGVKDQTISSGCGCSNKGNGCSGCSNKKSSCSGCSSARKSHSGCGGCKTNTSNTSKTVGDLYNELKKFIDESDVKEQTIIEFIDLDKTKLEGEFDRIEDIINKGFEPPITVIDNIIRYYGGISNSLVYKDIKELLE